MEDKRREELIQKIEDGIKALPKEGQRAICWIITHMDMVEEICKKSKMSVTEIKRCIIEAKNKKDYMMLALLYILEKYIEGEL